MHRQGAKPQKSNQPSTSIAELVDKGLRYERLRARAADPAIIELLQLYDKQLDLHLQPLKATRSSLQAGAGLNHTKQPHDAAPARTLPRWPSAT
jgi:hypothetical protein